MEWYLVGLGLFVDQTASPLCYVKNRPFPRGHNPLREDYKRILTCLHQGLTPKDTAFVAKVSENLVYEYINLIEENQLAIKEQMCINLEDILNDPPF